MVRWPHWAETETWVPIRRRQAIKIPAIATGEEVAAAASAVLGPAVVVMVPASLVVRSARIGAPPWGSGGSGRSFEFF